MSRWPVRISQTGGGPPPPPSSQDRFAPKYLVGNTNNGDSAVGYNTGGFRYIPDTGDGAGIALALTQPNGSGDVWIRPGTYDLSQPGSPSVPLVIPKGIRVQGAGLGSTIIGAKFGSGENQSVFIVNAAAQLRDLQIFVKTSAGEGADDYVVWVGGEGAILSNIAIIANMETNPNDPLRYLLRIDLPEGGPAVSLENVILFNDSKQSLTPFGSALLLLQRGDVSARNLYLSGGDYGLEVANAASGNGGNPQCSFRGDDIFIEETRTRGIYYHEVATSDQSTGSVRVHRGRIRRFQDDGDVGVLLNRGTGHTLSDCEIDTRGSQGSIGVLVTASGGGGTIADVTITGCEIQARSVGVSFQTTPEDPENTVTRGSVTDCNIVVDGSFYQRIGVGVVLASEITITSNHITVQGSSAEGNVNPTRAVYIVSSSDVVVDDNVIKTSAARTVDDVAIELGLQTQDADLSVQRVNVSDNTIVSSAQFAVRVRGSESKFVSVDGNSIRMFLDGIPSTVPPIGAIFSSAERTTITGNVVDHGSGDLTPPIGVAINAAGDRCAVTGNTIEMNSGSNDPAIAIQGTFTSCTGNSIGLTGQYPVAAILLLNTSSSCTCVSNTCGTVPPVDDQGALNEVAHNT